MAYDPVKQAKSESATNRPVREWMTKDVPTAVNSPIRASGNIRPRLQRNERRHTMRCHWEKLGVLGPIYGLFSKGISDREIANKLNLTEVTMRGCTLWLLHFLKCETRAELVLCASPLQQGMWSLRAP